jgi:hypothetical protein
MAREIAAGAELENGFSDSTHDLIDFLSRIFIT